jgi:hypothetical protein
MTLSFWDAGVIAGWIVAWLFLAGVLIGGFVSMIKRRNQRNEVYERLRKSVNTQEDFDKIVRDLRGGTT